MSPAPSTGMTPDELQRRMDANKVADRHELAAMIGINQTTVWRWLSGKTAITIGMAALIRQTLPKLPRK